METTSTSQYSLRWNNYQTHITYEFDSLRTDGDLVDVTLYCDGGKIKAHKILLSACSLYFKDIFKENPCKHPVVIFRNVKYEDLYNIVLFIYKVGLVTSGGCLRVIFIRCFFFCCDRVK